MRLSLIFGIIFLLLGFILSILFWIWTIRGIVAKVYGKVFGKKKIVSLISFFFLSMFFYLVSTGFLSFWFATGGVSQLAEKVSYVTAVNMESARKGWTKGLVKKLERLDFSVEKVCEIGDDYENIVRSISSTEKFTTYEIYMIVENPDSNSIIRYSELRKSNIAYARDEKDVFIPAYVVNHVEFDSLPFFLKWLLPSYRRDQKKEFIPEGKSYLNIRVDIPEGHSLKKVGLGDKTFEIDESLIVPLKELPEKDPGSFSEK